MTDLNQKINKAEEDLKVLQYLQKLNTSSKNARFMSDGSRSYIVIGNIHTYCESDSDKLGKLIADQTKGLTTHRCIGQSSYEPGDSWDAAQILISVDMADFRSIARAVKKARKFFPDLKLRFTTTKEVTL